MKIELKNIVLIPSINEAYFAFTANLYINGNHAAWVRNSGKDIVNIIDHTNSKGWDLIGEAEAYCPELLPKGMAIKGGADQLLNLSRYIHLQVLEHAKQLDRNKFLARVQKRMNQAVVAGNPEALDEIKFVKLSQPVKILLTTERGREEIRQAIQEVLLPDLKAGKKVLNRNISQQIFKDAGLKPEQYVAPEESVEKTKRNGLKGL